MKRVPAAEARAAEHHVRRAAIESLVEQCGSVVEGDEPGRERRFLVKATKPDGRRVVAAVQLVDQFGTTHLDVTPTSPETGRPAGETVSLALPPDDLVIAVLSHQDVSLADLEDAAFLTRDLRTPRSRLITAERREVSEIDRGWYQQLSGSR